MADGGCLRVLLCYVMLCVCVCNVMDLFTTHPFVCSVACRNCQTRTHSALANTALPLHWVVTRLGSLGAGGSLGGRENGHTGGGVTVKPAQARKPRVWPPYPTTG